MRRFFQLLLLLSSVVVATPDVTIYGPNYAKPLFSELNLSFSLSRPYILDYVSITQATTANITTYLSAGEPVLVNTLDAIPNGSVVFPMFGSPITVVHSVPMEHLNLSQSVLVDIFVGKIRWWNHTNLTDLNTGLPDQPIILVTGSLLSRTAEAMSIFAKRTITGRDIPSDSLSVFESVCPTVIAKPFSIGFAWLGDALAKHSQVASVVNRDGYLVNPSIGVSSALSEYFLIQTRSPPGVQVQPHNMHGRFSWPMISLLYIVLPPNFKDCHKMLVMQHFISLVMFQTTNMDLLCKMLGWEPVKSLSFYGSTLGKVVATKDNRDVVNSLQCGTKEVLNYSSVGTSSQLATFMLKILAPYSAEIDSEMRLLSADSGITTYLDAMREESKSIQIDMSFTWQSLLKDYSELLSVPVFMGSVVPWINLPGLSVPLVLDRATLVAIYSGVITSWNDEKIQALNVGVSLPAQNITVYAAAAGSGEIDGPTAALAKWLTAGAATTFEFVGNDDGTTPIEAEVRLYVDYFPYSIGYGFGHDVVNATRSVPSIIGSGGSPITFSSDALAACWTSLDDPKCWPMAIVSVMVLKKPTDCAHQKHSVDFVEWMLRRGKGLDQFLVPNLDANEKMGAAEYCKGRSLLVTYPEPQPFTGTVKGAQALAGVGMVAAAMQAIALGVARKRSELKSASVVFSLLAVVGAFIILVAPLLIARHDITAASCNLSVWVLCLGYSLCFGSIFAKLFRLYTIFTSRKLVVPRLSNKKLLMMVSVFMVLDVILLIIYSTVSPPEPYVFEKWVPSTEDLVTGQRRFTLEMCSFHVDSPVLYIILIYKCLVALGGAMMAFFIRQVDRRFSSSSALGLCFYNLFITVLIAIIIQVQFNTSDKLERGLSVPMIGGLWIMIITLCALTLDSNVLLACKDFSQPLRKMLNSEKTSKDSKDRSGNASPTNKSTSGENIEDPDSTTKRSHSSTVFVVNREMFPSKYETFETDLLQKFLQELNFQRAAVRRVLNNSNGTQNNVEMSDTGERHRSSAKFDSPALRYASKSRAGVSGPLTLSQESSTGSSSNSSETSRMANGMLKEMLPEPLGSTWSNSSECSQSEFKIAE